MSNKGLKTPLWAALIAIATISTTQAYDRITIDEIYSNTCGSRQFIELGVPDGHGDVIGRQIKLFDHLGNPTRTLTFSADLVLTHDSKFLIATPNLAAAYATTADAGIAALNPGDLDIEGGAIWFGCCGGTQDVDVVVYGNYSGPLPPTGTNDVTAIAIDNLADGISLVRQPRSPNFNIAIPTPTNLTGAIAKPPLAGDINGDKVLDLNDAATLANVLVDADTDAAHVARADLNCSGNADGPDIQAFLDLLFAPSDELPDCPSTSLPYVGITYDPLNSFVTYTGGTPTTPFFTWGLATTDVPNLVYMATEGQLWASQNDGCSWTSIGLTDSLGLFRIEAGPLGFAYAWADNGTQSFGTDGVYRIRNNPVGSSNFEVVSFRDPVGSMHGFGVDMCNPYHVRTGDDGGQLFESFDGGETWQPIGQSASPSTPLSYVLEFDPNDLNHVVFGQVTNGAFVTFDGGDTWTQSTGLRSLPHRGNNFFAATISPLDSNIVFGMGIDMGETGLPGDPPPPPSNGRHIYASTDGGLSFTPVLSQGTGGGEPGEGVFMQNGPVMKSDWRIPTKFSYMFSANCQFGGTTIYSYDLATGIIDAATADDTHGIGCIPSARQFEFSRTRSDELMLGFEFFIH